MELRIAGWQSEGLRCPDVAVSLVDARGEKSVVSIIQMPNGTGKTTTLELLRASLTGAAQDWGTQKVMEYKSPREVDEGKFRVDLVVDGKPLVFELRFDFIAQRVLYVTTSPSIGGQRDGWQPSPEVRRFLHADFVDLIVFDGEFASDILDPKKTNAERAVDAMSQLYLLDKARNLAEQEKERIISEAGVAGSQMALKQTETKLNAIKKQLERIRQGKAKFEKRLAEGLEGEKVKRTEFDEIARRQKGADELLEQARNKVLQSKLRMEKSSLSTFESIRIPSLLCKGFADNLKNLHGGLDAVRLPESSSKQFFIELAQADTCVCGRPIGEQERNDILETSEKYLGEEHSGVLNSIKNQVQSVVESPLEKMRDVQGLGEKLADLIEDYYKAKTDLDELEEHLAAPGGDLARIRDELEKIVHKNQKLKDALEEINRSPNLDDGPTTHCLAALEKQKKELDKKRETLTGTVDVGERTRIISELLTKSKEKVRDVVRRQLVEKGNTRLSSILRQSPVQIESMQSHVKLLSQGDASVGQKLAVGYVMLGGLLNRGVHSLPFVVDSPANPIDNTVRREVAKMLPELCDQFITFVISSEKPAFTDVLGEHAHKSQFITIFRKLEATAPYLKNLPSTGVLESNDFVLVEDRRFFDAFDVDNQ
ncbi:MAG: hypothetical protein ABW087_00310 [Candidatus Thiodiazotropha sp.]